MTRFLNLTLCYFNYGPEKLPHSVPKGPLGLVQEKVFQGNIYLKVNIHNKEMLRGTTALCAKGQGLPKFKRAENCPNFSFFLFGPGYFNYGPGKLPHSVPKVPLGLVQGKVFSGKYLPQSEYS
jgi:hypothetical protein